MCVYKQTIRNLRYVPNKKNGGIPAPCPDDRLRKIQVPCTKCRECRTSMRRNWMVRNIEEIQHNRQAVFFTGTFTDERIKHLCNKYKIEENDYNGIAKKEVRLFLERIRKTTGKSVKHFIITERGKNKTERIHIHGIIYANEGMNKLELASILKKNWIAGFSYNGTWCNEKTVAYVSKYITKTDEKHKDFRPKVFVSAGLGRCFIDKAKTWEIYQFKGGDTATYYRLWNGVKIAMPRYWKEKLWTPEQREIMQIANLDRGYTYIGKEKVRNITPEEQLTAWKLTQWYRKYYKDTYGDNPDEWEYTKAKNKADSRRRYIKCREDELTRQGIITNFRPKWLKRSKGNIIVKRLTVKERYNLHNIQSHVSSDLLRGIRARYNLRDREPVLRFEIK